MSAADQLRTALLAALAARPMGEGSLRSWGSTQRPRVGLTRIEVVLEELETEGLVESEERADGTRLWRLVREEDEDCDDGQDEARDDAEECPRCAEHQEDAAEAERREREARLSLAAALGATEAATWRDLLARVRQAPTAPEADGELSAARIRIEELTSALDQAQDRERALEARLREATTTAPSPEPPAADVRQYLLSLPADRWASLTTARQQLAEARALQERAVALQAQALASLDGPQAPAPETQGLPPETQEPPRGSPRSPRPYRRRGTGSVPGAETVAGRVLALIRERGQATVRELTVALGADRGAVEAGASRLVRRGHLERAAPGTYRLARRGRRAA